MGLFRIFEALIVLAILYVAFKFLRADFKIINKKVNDEIKKGDQK